MACKVDTSGLELLKAPHLRFGALTFCAKIHKGDTCGSNGLPLTPNSIIIYGKAQLLKTLQHPHLCRYLDILRGKHERTIVVSQYSGSNLSTSIGKEESFDNSEILKIAHHILLALSTLHKNGITHHNLSTDNVLLQTNGDIKLFNYGLYYMTENASLVSFPIMQVIYSPPEVFLTEETNEKVDVWSLGIILTELLLNRFLWCNLKLGQAIRKILSLMQSNTTILERICREHSAYDVYKNLDADLKSLIEDCLSILPQDRPDCDILLQSPIFEGLRTAAKNSTMSNGLIDEPYVNFDIEEFYHWWQLAGGDVNLELKKQGLIRSSPPILALPSLVTLDANVLGQERSRTSLFDTKVVQMPLEALYDRLAHLPLSSFYPIIHYNSSIIRQTEVIYDLSDLPLVIREKDTEYQFHRIILLRRLLYAYPYTRSLICDESETDIPPLLRGDIWCSVLEVRGDCEQRYASVDKITATQTDRQIEVDIPRCHQYNELLSSAEGHRKLKRVLKAWVNTNPQYVYWQGLDSLCAPFLFLNFNNEAKAFACLSTFIPKYLHKFFLKDNSAVIQEYLAKFSQLIAFHDPELANHLDAINFIPELFAIPWFLTMFSHVFPLHKILHLWDRLLLRDSAFPLHIGLSVLAQLRRRLLDSGFNECILLFSDLPEVDIERCVKLSTETYRTTPPSVTARIHQNADYYPIEKTLENVTLRELRNERCPRISPTDVIALFRDKRRQILVVDIRNPTQFSRNSVIGSINIPYSGVQFGDAAASLGPHRAVLMENEDKVVVIVGDGDTDMILLPNFLVQCNVSRVCVLHGGFKVLSHVRPNIFTTF